MSEQVRKGHPLRRRALGLVVASALALSIGCAGTDDLAGVEAAGGGAPEDPGPDREPEAAPAPPQRPEPREQTPPPPTPAACDPERDGTIGVTVSTQLDAFSGSDFARAYAMTSPFFRRVLDADAFETLIRTEYPELVGNDGHRLGECLVRGRRGSLIAGVRAGTQEVVLRYDLSEEADGWRIDGARRLPAGALPPQPLA